MVAFGYDAGGRLVSVTDPAGNAYSFTVGGSLTNVTFPDGGTWSYAYDADAFLTAKTDPNGALTTYRYDDRHRVVSSIDPEGRERQISYPENIQAVRTTTFTEKDGGVWQYTYDTASGDLLAKTDPSVGGGRSGGDVLDFLTFSLSIFKYQKIKYVPSRLL